MSKYKWWLDPRRDSVKLTDVRKGSKVRMLGAGEHDNIWEVVSVYTDMSNAPGFRGSHFPGIFAVQVPQTTCIGEFKFYVMDIAEVVSF